MPKTIALFLVLLHTNYQLDVAQGSILSRWKRLNQKNWLDAEYEDSKTIGKCMSMGYCCDMYCWSDWLLVAWSASHAEDNSALFGSSSHKLPTGRGSRINIVFWAFRLHASHILFAFVLELGKVYFFFSSFWFYHYFGLIAFFLNHDNIYRIIMATALRALYLSRW